ncbi:MAG: pilus assembly protein PilM [Candidatus Magasanikbacteria bacterium]
MSLFSHNQDAYLGIDIGAHGMKCVELHKTKGRPQLWTYGIASEPLDIHPPVPVEKTPEQLMKETKSDVLGEGQQTGVAVPQPDDPRVKKYAAMLKNLIEQSKVTTRQATASLPISEVFHTMLTLPVVEKKDVEGIIQAEIQKFLHRPVDEMQIMHQMVPTENKNHMRVLVTAATKSIISFYTAIFQKAGLELRELETEAFALERSLVGRDTSNVFIVDIGSERTNFFVISESLPIIHRSINIGGDRLTAHLQEILGVDAIIVDELKRDMSRLGSSDITSDIMERIINPITKEVKYSLDVFLRQNGESKRPEKIVLTGGSSVIPYIAKRLTDEFQIKAFVGDPWARVVHQQGLKPVLDAIGPRMAVSIGLALRNIVE